MQAGAPGRPSRRGSVLRRLAARVAKRGSERRGRRIFILPTGHGVAFACLLLGMLLGSMNYGASLGFALTFLLTGVGLVALHHCHANLLGVDARFAGAEPVFAGERAVFRIAVSEHAGTPRHEIAIDADGTETAPTDIEAGGTAVLTVSVPTQTRGRVTPGRMSLITRHPANLCRAWRQLKLDADCVVYPRPAPPGRPMPQDSDEAGDGRPAGRGDADFGGLRNAVRGDPPRRIAWKAYARSGELLLKEFTGGERPGEVFDWDALAGLDGEARLSQLARWCLDASADGRAFGLRLPSQHIAAGSGRRHLHRCLQALALFPADADRGGGP